MPPLWGLNCWTSLFQRADVSAIQAYQPFGMFGGDTINRELTMTIAAMLFYQRIGSLWEACELAYAIILWGYYCEGVGQGAGLLSRSMAASICPELDIWGLWRFGRSIG